jgi:cytoskeletal protein RodZ
MLTPLPVFAAGGAGHGVDPEFIRSFIFLAIWAFLALVAALLWPVATFLRRRRERKELAKKQEAAAPQWQPATVPQANPNNITHSPQKSDNISDPASGSRNP